MPAKRARDGVGHRAYRREQDRLKRRTKAENLPCGYGSTHGWGCGQPIDTTLDARDRWSFTADHDDALNNGGQLLGTLVPMHRRCNSQKSDAAPAEVWAAS